MKNQYVNMLQEGDRINDYFAVVRKDLRTKQDGGKFLGLVFRDKTGEIGGILWNSATDVARLFDVGDVVNVKGQVATYQSRMQIRIEQVLSLNEGDYSMEDLMPGNGEGAENTKKLRAILETVQNEHIKRLIDAFWQDDGFTEAFAAAVAAKKWHHEFPGGLARHCYEMARMAETVCELFPEIDRDVLLAGVFLHDVGKLHELTHDLVVDYTNEGKLIGHLQIGCDMVQEKMNAIDGFPPKLRIQMLHCILSHHGELQNGSPVTPRTIEAIALHHIDNLDAQTEAFSRVIRETRSSGREWSDYLPLIDRVIWTK